MKKKFWIIGSLAIALTGLTPVKATHIVPFGNGYSSGSYKYNGSTYDYWHSFQGGTSLTAVFYTNNDCQRNHSAVTATFATKYHGNVTNSSSPIIRHAIETSESSRVYNPYGDDDVVRIVSGHSKVVLPGYNFASEIHLG